MRAFLKLTWIEFKLFTREPVGFFFTFAFPIVVLFIFGSIFGNEPSAMFGGDRGNVDVSVPAYVGMIIGTIGLLGLPVGLSTHREQGVLRRFRTTPLKPVTVLGSQVVVNLFMLVAGVIPLIVIGRLVYNLALPDSFVAVFLAILFGAISFFALGFLLAAVLPTARTAQVVGMGLFFPMLFLAGAAMPREMFPETLRKISDFLPLTHVINLIKDAWFGADWNTTSIIVLVVVFVIGVVVSSYTFRWE